MTGRKKSGQIVKLIWCDFVLIFDFITVPSTLGIQLLFSLKNSSGHRASGSQDQELRHCEDKVFMS